VTAMETFTVDAHGNIWVLPSGGGPMVEAGASGLPYFPLSQTVTTVNDTFADLFSVQSTGGTDTVGPFALAVGGKTYGGVLTESYFLGYNALAYAGTATGSTGAAVLNFIPDAGDTDSSGAHGVEINLSWLGPGAGAGGATGGFQMVCVNDETNTVITTIRCGSGTSGVYGSDIVFQNGNASTTFLVMSNSSGDATFDVPVAFSSGVSSPLTISTNATSSPASLTLSALGATSSSTLTLEGNNGGLANGTIAFNTNGTVQWQLEHTPPYLYLKDTVNGRSAFYFYPGATAAAAKFQVLSVLQSSSSIVCGTAAIATNATDGFLYLPSCAGAPTGAPTVQTGTVPCVFDTTDGKLYFYTGGAWVGLAD
jgi:hypothetical protein